MNRSTILCALALVAMLCLNVVTADDKDETIIIGENGEIVYSGGKKDDTIIIQRRRRDIMLADARARRSQFEEVELV